MEVFGIIFSVPVIFAASNIYVFIIGKVIARPRFLAGPLWWISVLLVAMAILESICAMALGPVRLREIIGPSYYGVHVTLFVLAVPGLVNIMKLQERIRFLTKWYVIGTSSALFGLCVILLQYAVSEGLYGIDGMGGPYGKP
jgi:hypothetical protein